MRKIKKITYIMIIIAIIFSWGNQVFALENIKNAGDEFVSKGNASSVITTDEAWEILKPIGQILVAVASVVLVIAYMYLGIQYMITDPGEKANIKQKLIGLVIATVLIYGATGLFAIIINLANSIFN